MISQLVYLAIACLVIGFLLVFLLILAAGYFSIDLSQNWWLLAIPTILSVVINIFLIEVFWKGKKR